jgi:NADPH:quinone reductase-like Zn-dependent oxidoreductase
MKAVVYEKYGPPDVLKLTDVEKPAPQDGKVIVKVMAVSLNSWDLRFLRADPFLVRIMGGGFLKPKNHILGADISGVIESVGKEVTRFKPGDAVFGDLAGSGSGGLAEYTCARDGAFAMKPAGMGFEEAAALPMAAVTALQGLRDKGRIRPGQKVLINGASGGVGTFAVQIATVLGAEVTAVCSAGKQELARSLGADHVIDYGREDFTNDGKAYNLILGVNGYHPIRAYKRALAPGGTYVMIGGSTAQIMQAMLFGKYFSKDGKKMGAMTAASNPGDLEYIAGLVEAGKLRPVIDRRYPLSEAVEAFRYLAEGHARGKVVITVEHGDN